MGKGGKGKHKSPGYVHQHNHNPKAKNSDERRLELVKTIQVSRLSKLVDRQKALLKEYIPEDKKKLNAKKPGINEVLHTTYSFFLCLCINFIFTFILL